MPKCRFNIDKLEKNKIEFVFKAIHQFSLLTGEKASV